LNTAAIPRLGLWTTSQNRARAVDWSAALSTLDDSVFGQVWVGEGGGRDPFLASALALATCRLPVGIGIANVHARDSTAAVACERDLLDRFPDRLVAGYGVSHPRQLTARGAQYGRPLTVLREYLEALAEADERYPGILPED
jgi:hypothetical protein